MALRFTLLAARATITTLGHKVKFYDHCKNTTNAAVASAMARVRRESIDAGQAYRVEFTPPGKDQSFYWDGGRYDALRLAKDLLFNRHTVTLTRPDGSPVDIENAMF